MNPTIIEPENKKKISELIVRYTLEPEMREIYVEGADDKSLLESFLKENGCKSVDIFLIDTVDVPDKLVDTYGMKSYDEDQPGNRDRVITLSLEFEKLLKTEARYLLCVADSDFDFVLGVCPSNAQA